MKPYDKIVTTTNKKKQQNEVIVCHTKQQKKLDIGIYSKTIVHVMKDWYE
jgi:hypothetical protein